ncbi:hypothetical protein [Streptomyces goshikiensis]|uniref:hypothetical protein n=1 Tax=Streptomyces goshikiensis TaxID=1942 RepID=UPI002ADF532D|nr:hypothetical protein [Streptomyces goshikiensis]
MSQWISLVELVTSLAGAGTATFALVTVIAESRRRSSLSAARQDSDESRPDSE